MKDLKAWWKRLKNNRKFRCGGFSAALTAGAVALVLLLSVVADGLESRYALQVDCSFNGATTQGEITRAVLSQLKKDVTLYAVVPASGGDETLLSILNRYDAASDHVRVQQESLIKNPVLQNWYSDSAGKNSVTDDCLIVTCPDMGRTRILTANDYVEKSYNLDTGFFDSAAYCYEKSITEALLYVTQEQVPTIQILTGHREKDREETALMEETLVSANYQIKRVSLAAGDKLDPESPLMLLSPQYDFSDEELDMLMDFARAGGGFFVTVQYDDPLDLSNFNALLRSFGVEAYPGIVIAQAEDNESYYADSPMVLLPSMQETDVTRSLLSAGEKILMVTIARGFHQPAVTPDGVMLSPVLMSGDAYVRHYRDGKDITHPQEGDETGQFPVALWADKMFDNGQVSHLFIQGDITMFLDIWMEANTSSTAYLLQIMRTLQGQEPVNLDIVPKTAQRESLTLGSLTPAVIVTVMLPLLVLLGAALVLWPRRNL